MSTRPSDLFSSLHRWARHQDENFTTEALFFVIRLLQERCPEAASEILARLTGGAVSSTIGATLVVTETQVHTPKGIPDARISAPGVEVFLEAKVTAEIRPDQLAAYHRQLKDSTAPATKLVLLSHYPPGGSDLPAEAAAVRWYEIGEWLEGLLNRRTCDPISSHYVAQFIEFLRSRGLAIIAVSSPISAALAAYHAKTGSPLLENRRFRSLNRLALSGELSPLVSLLKLMDLALKSLAPQVTTKFDTGKHHGGWIGYNLKAMEYFFYLNVQKSDTLIFEAFLHPFDESLWDGRTGEAFTSFGRRRWRNSLDLADPALRFFGSSKATQLAILESFLSLSYVAAQRFTALLPSVASAAE